MANFNFTRGGHSPSNNNLIFPAVGGVSGLPEDFNFTEGGYSPTSYDFNFGEASQIVFNLFGGTSNNFVAIWADPTASLTNGKMYASSQSAFSVVSMDDDSLYDFYTTTHKGRGNETLESDTVIDLNVV